MLAACASARPIPPAEPVEAPTPAPVAEVEATRLAKVDYRPLCLALDADHVYWTVSRAFHVPPGSVWRVAKAGGEPEMLATDVSPGRCLVVGDELWFTHDSKLWAIPTSGGARRQVANVAGELVHGPGGVYVANMNGLYRVSPAGITTTINVRTVTSIAGGDVVCFVTEDERGRRYTLWRHDRNNSVELATLPYPPGYLAVRGDSVFVATTNQDSVRALLAVPLAGGPARELVRHDFSLEWMWLGAEDLYWGTNDTIMRMPLPTGTPSVFVIDPEMRHTEGMGRREHLVADDESLYWLSIDVGHWQSSSRAAIMRAPLRPSAR
jgi:hypothetical protein